MGNCIGSDGSDHSNQPRSNIETERGVSERNHLLPNNPTSSQQSYGTPNQASPSEPSQQQRDSIHTSFSKSSAKPIGQFKYLDQKYSVTTPECGILDVDTVFKSVCERYDIAVTNREKIDEALMLFKQILDLDLDTPLEECFFTWKSALVNPQFTVNHMEPTGDVKDIRVRADNIPKAVRKAQKHIRDLLDACHLFLQQREFLQRNISNDLTELDTFSRDLQRLADQAKLSSSKKKYLGKNFSGGLALVATFPQTLELFWRQTYSLMHEINTSVHVLDGVPGPDSAYLH